MGRSFAAVVLNRGDGRGHWARAGDIVGCYSQVGVATGIEWVEARDAVQHLTTHGPAPCIKNYLAPNVHSAGFEKPWFRGNGN